MEHWGRISFIKLIVAHEVSQSFFFVLKFVNYIPLGRCRWDGIDCVSRMGTLHLQTARPL